MGFYDERCMVTGVSLKGAGAVLVLLLQAERDYHPIALGIKGSYNRLGSIDSIAEDANTQLVLDYFLARLEDGAFVVDADYLASHQFYPFDDIERLLGAFERNINDGGDAVLAGQPPVFALVSWTIWETLAAEQPPSAIPCEALFQQVFEKSPVAAAIYEGKLQEVTGPLRELATVSAFLRQRHLVWKPADDGSQDYADDMRNYLAEARRVFADCPVILEALSAYEEEVADLLEDT
jgi:hypothetical protein